MLLLLLLLLPGVWACGFEGLLPVNRTIECPSVTDFTFRSSENNSTCFIFRDGELHHTCQGYCYYHHDSSFTVLNYLVNCTSELYDNVMVTIEGNNYLGGNIFALTASLIVLIVMTTMISFQIYAYIQRRKRQGTISGETAI